MDIPGIADVKRLHLEPGDALVVRADIREVSDAEAAMLKERVRTILQLPDVPVLVIGSDMDIEVVSHGRP